MANKHFLRGMATINYFADDVTAARDWYTELFGIEAYFRCRAANVPPISSSALETMPMSSVSSTANMLQVA